MGIILHKSFQNLDMTGDLFSFTFHGFIWFLAWWEALEISNP